MIEAKYVTVENLNEEANSKYPRRSIESCHLHFNGPGAAGFGVKRTAMLLPDSVMLLVAPSCCGRHGTITGEKSSFSDRMFYYRIDERSLVTGNYLKAIPQAAKRIKERYNPKVILLCMTCVDAIMGTDLSRIARKIEQESEVKCVACYMDPISREGRRAPMVSVWKCVFSALLDNNGIKDMSMAGILGGFVGIDENSDLFDALAECGIDKTCEIAKCKDYDEFQNMSHTGLNVVINSQTAPTAEYLEKRFGTPYIELHRYYAPKRITAEYVKLFEYFNKNDSKNRLMMREAEAEKCLTDFAKRYSNQTFGIGEAINGNPFELAETLIDAGLSVAWVFRNIITKEDDCILKRLMEKCPKLRIYSGVHPSTANGSLPGVDIIIGLDAGYYQKEAVSVCWNMERQTFGYSGLQSLLDEIDKNWKTPVEHRQQLQGSYLTV